MIQKHKIQLFEDQKIRTMWDDEMEEWYFSIVDVCGVLTEQKTSRGASTYWAVLKNRLSAEGADELLTNCKRLRKYDTNLSLVIVRNMTRTCPSSSHVRYIVDCIKEAIEK